MDNSFGTPISSEDHFRRFDALPAPMRAVVTASPFDWHPVIWEEVWKACKPDVALARRELIRHIARNVAPACAETYGDDHPCVARFATIAAGKPSRGPSPGASRHPLPNGRG
jgi:hypothetical protein